VGPLFKGDRRLIVGRAAEGFSLSGARCLTCAEAPLFFSCFLLLPCYPQHALDTSLFKFTVIASGFRGSEGFSFFHRQLPYNFLGRASFCSLSEAVVPTAT